MTPTLTRTYPNQNAHSTAITYPVEPEPSHPSTITGTMWIVDARNGAVLMKPATVRGAAKGGWVGGGLIGVALTKEPQEDYRATVAGFAADVRKRLFGKQT